MRVAIVGSRGFTDHDIIRKAITSLHEKHEENLIIVSGGAMGADSIAEQIARELHIETLIHWPDWNRFGKSAGFKRNIQIVEDSDMVVAFFADGPQSLGTRSTVMLATLAKKTVHTYHAGVWS